MAEVALMPRIDDVPEFSVDFHVRIVEVVAERGVVILVIVIVIVASNRRFGRTLGEASVRVRDVVEVFARGLMLLGRVFIISPLRHGQPRFGCLSSVITLGAS